MKKAQKSFAVLCVLAALLLCCVGCGEESQAETAAADPVTYKTYTTKGVTYEIPDNWNVTQKRDGSIEGDMFSVEFKENYDVYLCNDFMDYMDAALETYTSESSFVYREHEIFTIYVYESIINDGKQTPLKCICLHTDDDNVVIFTYICDPKLGNYEEIYDHLMNSFR